MKLKGIRTIALLLAAVVLVIGSVAGMVAAGGEDRGGPYWWEEDPYEQRQLVEIVILVLDRYFGIDVSRMSQEEMDEVGRSIGPEGQERVHWLIKYYALKKGFEIPEPVPCKPPLVDPPVEDVYWWEIVGCPEGEIEATMRQIAEAKGMSPDEVRERFGELFPGVDLWRMTFEEFDEFLDSLPRPPFRLICFEEMARDPGVIALFGRVPSFSTAQETKEFVNKLGKIWCLASPELRKRFGHCDFPWVMIDWSRGAIYIRVEPEHLPRAAEIYKIIAEKAESLFGIKDVPVIFRGGVPPFQPLNACDSPQAPQASYALPQHQPPPPWEPPPHWQAPWNEPFAEIPGAVKVTPSDAGKRYSTASFAVRRSTWWDPFDPWDEDYIITGHKGPGGTITPVNMHMYQPLSPHAAGQVHDNVGVIAYADAAPVAICDGRVCPYILIGGSPSNPALRPVFASGDVPAPLPGQPGEVIWISAGRSGVTFSVEVVRYGRVQYGPFWELRNQLIGASAACCANTWRLR
ncbi:hypothetical protein M1O18_04355 [Dehalococcoidia bacterium]|nr:hypothetical protein [Dehalococcoidia bacterium]